MEKHDVVVVGAGPAGLKAAEVLAGEGKDVLVLEKNRIVGPKVCAGGITLKDIKMGIPEELFERKFFPVFKTKRITLKCNKEKAIITTLSRGKLGQWQRKRAEAAGAIVKTGTRVKIIEDNCIITDKEKIGFDFLIGADGSSSVIRRELGIRTQKMLMAMQYVVRQNYDEMKIFLDSDKFKSGYAWLFPHNGGTSVGCCADMRYISPHSLRKNFEKWLAEQEIDVIEGRFEASPINYDYRGYEFGNVYLVGEAAGLASGLTGEGIYFAIASGEDVAKRILHTDHDTEKIKEILSIKKKHDYLLLLLQKSRCFRAFAFDFCVVCMKNKAIRKRFIQYLI